LIGIVPLQTWRKFVRVFLCGGLVRIFHCEFMASFQFNYVHIGFKQTLEIDNHDDFL